VLYQTLVRLCGNAGITITGGGEDETYCLCPFHKDRHTSMSINPQKEKWICYRGCGGGSLKSLWNRLGFIPDYEDEDDLQLGLDLEDKSVVELPEGLQNVQEIQSIVNWLRLERGINRIGIVCSEIFNLKSDGQNVYYTVFHTAGDYLGYLVQDIQGGKPISYVSKSITLYGLLDLELYYGMPKDNDELVIVEGPMDLIKCVDSNVIKYGGALMGSGLSEKRLLSVVGAFDHVKLFLDGDIPGRKATLKIADILLRNGIDGYIVDWGDDYKNDPGSISADYARTLLDSALTIPEFLSKDMGIV